MVLFWNFNYFITVEPSKLVYVSFNIHLYRYSTNSIWVYIPVFLQIRIVISWYWFLIFEPETFAWLVYIILNSITSNFWNSMSSKDGTFMNFLHILRIYKEIFFMKFKTRQVYWTQRKSLFEVRFTSNRKHLGYRISIFEPI